MMPSTRTALAILDEWIDEAKPRGLGQNPTWENAYRYCMLQEIRKVVESAAPCMTPNGMTDAHMKMIEPAVDSEGNVVFAGGDKCVMRCAFCKELEPSVNISSESS